MSDSVVSSKRRDAGGVLQRDAHDLGRIDDAGGHQVAVLIAVGVVAFVLALHLANAIDDHGAVDAGVVGDALQRIVQHVADDLRAERLVAFELELVERLSRCEAVPRRRRERCPLPAPLAWRSWRLRAGTCVPSFRSRSRRRR